MKKLLLGFVALLTAVAAVAQNSFSYQAVIRDGGKVLENKAVSLRLSVMLADSVYYKEVHQTTTNAYGNVNVNVGEGTGLQGSFTAIPWETMQVMMQVEVSTDGSTYTNMGALQIQPVPYTMYASRTTTVIQPKVASDEPIFQVKDNDGNLLFAVYETGVKVFVDYDDDSKAAKAKFAVASIRRNKGEEDLLTVDNQGATIYIDDDDNQNGKAAKAKFAVASIRRNKGDENLLTIDDQGATIYIDDDDNQNGKAAKAKFAVASIRRNKGDENLMTVDDQGATIYVDDNDNYNQNGKAAKAKFAVASIRRNKGDENLMTVDGSGSVIYVDDNQSDKAAKAKFAVASIRRNKGDENLFTIDGDGSTVYVDFNANKNTDADKAAKAKFAVAGRSGKGGDDVLNVDGDQATFYIDLDENENDKAAKSTFAVASIRRGKTEPEPYFIIDRFGSLVYIDDDSEAGKAAKAKFAVASISRHKDIDNYLTVDSDSARIYINDNTIGRSNFAIVDALRNLEMMMVNQDSTLINMNSYINVLQTASGKISSMYACKLTVTAMPNGAGSISAIYSDGTPVVFDNSTPGVFVADAIKGQKLILTANANDGYDFRGWIVGDSTITGNYLIDSLAGDMSLTAKFSQSVLYVSTEGQEGNAGNSINAALPSIVSAVTRINNSPDKDDWTICVVGELQGAQYLGYDSDADIDVNATSITLKGKNGGTLKGAYKPENGAPEASDDIYSVLDIYTEVPVTIEDLTISNGYSYNGSGLYVGEYSNVTIGNGVVITNNMANNCGGGVYVDEDATLIMKGSATITGNTAPFGGGLFIAEGGEVQMQSGTISNNTAINSNNPGGGGVYAVGTMTMSGGLISGNQTVSDNNGTNSFGDGVYLGDYYDGNDDRQFATFIMSGYAKVAANNYVCLPGNYSSECAVISIAGNLAFDTAAVILPENYNRIALANAGSVDYVANNCGRFVVAPKIVNNDTTNYFIDASGEIRRFMELEETDRFKYYLSDITKREGFEWNDEIEELENSISNEYDGNYTLEADEYTYNYFGISGWTSYQDDDGNWHYHNSSFGRLATINEKGLLLPCKSDGIILLNSNSQESASGEDAVVMIRYYYDGDDYLFSLWPMVSLTNYKMTFALINEDWDGNATQYERYDFVVNCEKAYPGCKFSPVAYYNDNNSDYDKYYVKIIVGEDTTTSYVETSSYSNAEYSAAFGSTITLEALTAPEGMMFDYWLKKEYYSYSYGVSYSANPLQVKASNVDKVYFEAHFKEIPPIIVDGENGNDETGDGDKTPFKTLTAALRFIEAKNNDSETYKIKVLNYTDDIAVGQNIDGKASSIIINFGENGQYEGTTTAQHVIDINTTVPISISNLQMSRVSADRVINVPAGKSLILDNCTISGGTEDNLASVGGAYIGEGGKLTLKGSSIKYFSAENGGGVYVDGGELILVTDKYYNYAFVSNCLATSYGGGVYATNNGIITLSDSYSSVKNNEAERGGGIYLTGNATIDSKYYYSEISNNEAIQDGGAIYLDNGVSVTFNDGCYISSNIAGGNGGGVYVANGATLTVGKGKIQNCTAETNGGGMYIAYGGSAALSGTGSYESYKGYVYSNSSQFGGGVYVGGTFTMSGYAGVAYNGNKDAGNATNGGGVYVANRGVFTIEEGRNCEINDNYSESGGSGVYLAKGATLDMKGGGIYNNRKPTGATIQGTGVYVKEGATFNMKGYANTGTSNIIYLDKNAVVNITGDVVTYECNATFKPNEYKKDRQILNISDGATINISKFAIEKQTVTNSYGAEIDVEWMVDNDGKLQKAGVSGAQNQGALAGTFKISDSKSIRFSQGNLKYQASTGTWRFADNQTDKGDYEAARKASATSNDWVDRFGYGTSGWNSGATAYQPFSLSNNDDDYLNANLTGSNANADWGVYNAIENGGNTHGMWRTLTAEEWQYLLYGRGTETESKKKFGMVRINFSSDGKDHVVGILLLPDNWTLTSAELDAAGITFTPGENPTYNGKQGYDANIYTSTQWQLLEENGAVFLPAVGARSYQTGTSDGVPYVINGGGYDADGYYNYNGTRLPPWAYYWTANGGKCLYFDYRYAEPRRLDKNSGACVRLVADVADDGSSDGHAKVDLGLTSGKKWAAVNLGYTGPESSNYYVPYQSQNAYNAYPSIGDKYAWGETEPKGSFTFDNYKYKGEWLSTYNQTYTKYNDEDGLDVLELEDDAAYAQWGGNWRVPTYEDWMELWNECYWVSTRVATDDGNRYYYLVYKPVTLWSDDVTDAGVHQCKIGASSSNPSNYWPKHGSYGDLAFTVNYSNYDFKYWASSIEQGENYVFCVQYTTTSSPMNRSVNNRYDGAYIRPVWVPITTTVFYVSPEGSDSNDGTRNKPFATIQKAASKMIDKYTRYTIFVDGELDSEQELTGTIKARSITLRGAHGLDNSTGKPKDKINSGISVSTTVPVTVENLEITGSVTVGSSAKVTLAGGAVVSGESGVTNSGTFTMKNDAWVGKVSLAEGKTITVGKLTTDNITTITLSEGQYAPETQVLVKESGVEELPVSKFVMDDNTNWQIGADGKLAKISNNSVPEDFVYVAGAKVPKTITITNSPVFNGQADVEITDLYVCDHEVTQAEYETYCMYGGDETPEETGDDKITSSVYYVSWCDALVYCNLRSIAEGLTPVYSIIDQNGDYTTDPKNWRGIRSEGDKYCGANYQNYYIWDLNLGDPSTESHENVIINEAANGYRLPTSAEWEYIARGGNGLTDEDVRNYTYSGSNTLSEVAAVVEYGSVNYEIKTKSPNTLSIYDMSGNVLEWCFDWIGYEADYRVTRGVSGNLIDCSTESTPCSTSNDLGFRVVRNAIPNWLTSDENGHYYVDLGLNSQTKWATMNFGAEDKTRIGTKCSWNSEEYTGADSWGDNWSIATTTQWQELMNNCYWEFSPYNDGNHMVNGYNVYKAKDESDKGKFNDENGSNPPVGTYTYSDPHIFIRTDANSIYADDPDKVGYFWPLQTSEVTQLDTNTPIIYLNGDSSAANATWQDSNGNNHPIRLVYVKP
ncbi:MAG: SUMF1/EgtB/PvdO family nonheme iron enzyme [Salinivirgaceae bacterium]|nr:SUMF1/EgtB/PvdO family nonheme iron enzyme [Salinivirgaceae bacterium]